MTENSMNADSFESSLSRYVKIIILLMLISWSFERGLEKSKFIHDLIDKLFSQNGDLFGNISTE